MKLFNFISITLFALSTLFGASPVTESTPLNTGYQLCDAIPIIVDAPEITGNNSSASSEQNEPVGGCWWTATPINSIWYSFTAPTSGHISASTSFPNTSLGDTHIAIYDVGDCADMTTLTELGCDEDSGLLFTSFAEVNNLTPGNTYYIQVDGYQGDVGEFKIKVSEIPGCTGLLSPTNGSNNIPLNTPLVWSAITGMNNFSISISAPIGSNNITIDSILGNTTSFSPTQPWSPNTTYEIQILAFNNAGDTILCPSTTFTTIDFSSITTSPGGIKDHNVFWVKANENTQPPGSTVSDWQDQSGNLNHAIQGEVNSQPTYNTAPHNYNPGIYFDGNNDFLAIPNLIAANAKNLSVITVGTNEQGGDSWHAMVFGQSTSSWQGGGYGICGLDGAANSFGFWVNSWNTNAVATPLEPNKTTILEGKYEGSQIQFYKNNQLEGTAAYSGEIGSSGATFLGGGEALDYNHKGSIAEVIIYDLDLAENERRKINSYLAIKYGLTIHRDQDIGKYINSSEEIIYSSDSIFWHNIIGIGRDDLSGLLQKQSHREDDSTRIYLNELSTSNVLNTGSFSTNHQFIVIGDNGESISTLQQANAPMGSFRVFDRAWKIQNTNCTETFSLEFLMDKCTIDNIKDIRLLVSNSSDFSSAQILNQSSGLTIKKNGDWIQINGISNGLINQNTTAYITLATTQEHQLIFPFSKTLCPGTSLTINGTIYNETNPEGTELLTTINGCDSIVEIKLLFDNNISTDINQTLCPDEQIIVNGTTYNIQNPTGSELFSNINGCDSTVNVNLSFHHSSQSNIEQILCVGEHIIINGTSYNEQNPFGTELLSNSHGCDSTININLSFHPNNQSNIEQTLCPGDSIIINGTSYNEQNPSGVELLSNSHGCDSSININLEYYSDFPELEDDIFDLNTSETEELSIVENDYLPDSWNLHVADTNHPDWFILEADGTLAVLPQMESTEDLTIEYVICNTSCTQLCDTANILISKHLAPKEDVIVSEILTLNGDGKNDKLEFKDLNISTNEGIQIFNRWGNLVFTETPYRNNWAGTNKNGQELPNGTYYYVLSIKNAEGNFIKGDALLIK